MKIKYVEMRNFKSFKNKVRFDLFDNSLISGHNGSGKTTIAECIVFTLTGKSINGWTQIPDIVNIDNPKGDIETAIMLVDEESYRQCEIRRFRQGGKDRILFNGTESTEEEIRPLIKSADMFLSIFNTRYFAQILEANEKRALIEKLFDDVDYEAIFCETCDKEFLTKYNLNLKDQNEYKKIKTLIDSNKKTLLECETEIKVISDENVSIVTGELIQEKNEEEQNLKEKIEKCKKIADRQSELKRLIETSENAKKQIYQLDLELSNLKTVDFERIDVEELTKSKNEFVNKNNNAIMEFTSKVIPQASYPKILDLSGGNCPTCLQNVSPEYINQFNAKAKEIIKQYNEENQKIKQLIEKLKDDNNRAENAFNNKCKEYHNNMISFNNLETSRNEIINKKILLETLVYSITTKDQEILRFDTSNINSQYDNIIEYNNNAKLNNRQVNANREKKNQYIKRIDELNQTIYSLKILLDELNMIYDTIYPTHFVKKIIEKQISKIKDNLKYTTIELFKKTQSGTYKDVFEVHYKGKPFRMLSLSESILCGLEISNMINTLSGLKIPVFIDNIESISSIPDDLKPNVQLFLAKFVDQNPLSVTSIDSV